MGCEDYGMGHGCDIDCPTLWEGNCQAIGECMEQFISEDSITIKELLDLYRPYGHQIFLQKCTTIELINELSRRQTDATKAIQFTNRLKQNPYRRIELDE